MRARNRLCCEAARNGAGHALESGCLLVVGLLFFFIAQGPAEDLADDGFGQICPEFKEFWNFVVGEPRPAVRRKIGLAEDGSRLQNSKIL